MDDLVDEYRQTMKQTRQMYRRAAAEKECLTKKKDIEKAQADLKIINQMISSLSYAIELMDTGHFRGRELTRRSTKEREVLVADVSFYVESGQEESELPEPMEQEVKHLLVKELLRTMSPREKEIMELTANQFSQHQIAELVGLPKSTVQSILKRCKEKVQKEGWMLV